MELFEAARQGKVDVLAMLLQEYPSLLADIRLTSLVESVLHVATKSGQLDFARDIMKIDPDIARDINRDGYRVLDIAVIMGNLAIVEMILRFNRDLCQLKGKDNRTALHYAAVKGRVDIIDELLSTWSDAIQDITVYGETALHLALRHYQFDAFYELVKWSERLGKESIINIQDDDGDTILHLAVSTKQYACLNLLLDENSSIKATLELSVLNGKGLTALDISDIVMQDCYDAKIRETLQCAGAIRARDYTTYRSQNSPQLDTNSREPDSRNWVEYFKFKRERDSPSEARDTLLIVSALITTVTFQAAINPPSGLFDESRRLNTTNQEHSNNEVLFTSDFMFVFFNSLGFIASSLIMIYLTSGFPLYRELLLSTASIFVTYSAAMNINVAGTRADRKIQAMAWYIQLVALIVPHLLRRPPWLRKIGLRRRAVRNPGLPIGN
ncbi:hypothetical protein OROGR_023832 [Orobanche gracilis]